MALPQRLENRINTTPANIISKRQAGGNKRAEIRGLKGPIQVSIGKGGKLKP
jgi:hypothetical protein